jgi:hypothetical protein
MTTSGDHGDGGVLAPSVLITTALASWSVAGSPSARLRASTRILSLSP